MALFYNSPSPSTITMSLHALIKNGKVIEYPYDLSKLRKSVSLPKEPSMELLEEHGVIVVQESQKPDVDYTKNVIEGSPKLIKGKWNQTWTVTPATKEEILSRTEFQASIVKTRRNNLLLQSDWTQLPDVPINTSSQWENYRAKLRDITRQSGFPWSVEWPTSPTDTPTS